MGPRTIIIARSIEDKDMKNDLFRLPTQTPKAGLRSYIVSFALSKYTASDINESARREAWNICNAMLRDSWHIRMRIRDGARERKWVISP